MDNISNKFLSDSLVEKNIVSFLLKLQKKKFLPNLIFEGAPGTGKTSTARDIILNFFEQPMEYIELNSSCDRGIATIRNDVVSFSRGRPVRGDYRLVLLEEAENLTPDAQAALRNVMEAESNSCRYIFTCNDNRLDPAIKSRCVTIPFKIDLEGLSRKIGRDISELSSNPDLRIANRVLETELSSKNKQLYLFYECLLIYNKKTVEEYYDKLAKTMPEVKEIRMSYKKILSDDRYEKSHEKLIDIFLKFQYNLFINRTEEFLPLISLLHQIKNLILSNNDTEER